MRVLSLNEKIIENVSEKMLQEAFEANKKLFTWHSAFGKGFWMKIEAKIFKNFWKFIFLSNFQDFNQVYVCKLQNLFELFEITSQICPCQVTSINNTETIFINLRTSVIICLTCHQADVFKQQQFSSCKKQLSILCN